MLARILSVLILALLFQQASARPNCNVPNPPPICEAPDPSPPPPSPPLQAPVIGGGGHWSSLSIRIYVSLPVSNPGNVVIQRGPSANGPWTTWTSQPPSAYYASCSPVSICAGFDYTAPVSDACFRASYSVGSRTSAWSVAKCLDFSPAPTPVSITRPSAGAPVIISWYDNSNYDVAYIAIVTQNGQVVAASNYGPSAGINVRRSYPLYYLPPSAGPLCLTVFAAEQRPGTTSWPGTNGLFSATDPLDSAGTPATACAPGL